MVGLVCDTTNDSKSHQPFRKDGGKATGNNRKNAGAAFLENSSLHLHPEAALFDSMEPTPCRPRLAWRPLPCCCC